MDKLTLALAKGRISKEFIKMLNKSKMNPSDFGEKFTCFEEVFDTRKLILDLDKFNVILAKPADVPIYVKNGIADIGIVGKDVTDESGYDFYELYEFDFSKCKLSFAGPDKDFKLHANMVIGSKYPAICKNLYPEATVIKLNGSVELAPLLNLSDVILDIVETGTTLKENKLHIIADAYDVYPLLIANKSSYKFYKNEIREFMEVL